MKARAATTSAATAATITETHAKRVPVPAAPTTVESAERMRASAAIARIAHPPLACPTCYAERGLPSPRGTSGRTCAWHALVERIATAHRYPALWPNVIADYGDVVVMRLLARDLAARDDAGAACIDITVW